MGVVYQAWDDALGVAVALKVIRPEVTPIPPRRRTSSAASSASCCCALGHTPECGPHPRSRGSGRHQIPHDPYLDGSSLGASWPRRASSRLPRCSPLLKTSPQVSSRRTRPGLSTVTETGEHHAGVRRSSGDHGLGISRSAAPEPPHHAKGAPSPSSALRPSMPRRLPAA